jgi:hypothetical protein
VKEDVKFVPVIGPEQSPGELLEPVQDEPVDLEERLPGHQVRLGIKVVEVAEEITAGVSDPAIALDETGENFGGEPDVITVILRRYPQTENLCAVGGHDLLRGNDVPHRLGHLPSL